MKISRELALQILKYCHDHKEFYFPFQVMCKELSVGGGMEVVDLNQWTTIRDDSKYQTFELCENLQNLYPETVKLMSKGFIERITGESLEEDVRSREEEYRNKWTEELWESENIEVFGSNEYLGGQADAYEEALFLIGKHITTG